MIRDLADPELLKNFKSQLSFQVSESLLFNFVFLFLRIYKRIEPEICFTVSDVHILSFYVRVYRFTQQFKNYKMFYAKKHEEKVHLYNFFQNETKFLKFPVLKQLLGLTLYLRKMLLLYTSQNLINRRFYIWGKQGCPDPLKLLFTSFLLFVHLHFTLYLYRYRLLQAG